MNNIYIIADLHGHIDPLIVLKNTLEYAYAQPLDEKDTIICLGDVGANFYLNKTDKKFKTKLQELGCQLFFIRGNHEQRPSILAEAAPQQWEMREFFDNDVWVEKEYPNVNYAMDHPAAYNINGFYTFVFPGAYSVDKWYRLQNHWAWFENEQLTPQEMETGKKMVELSQNHCDLVLSHTCPSIFVPTDLFLNTIDQSMVDTTMERYLGEIEYQLQYKLWCFGHYHAYRPYPIYDNKQVLMLFNKEVLNLTKFIETNDICKSTIYIKGENFNA